jgi:hypothetical protein
VTDNQAKVVSLIDQYRGNPKAQEKPAVLPERAYKAYGVDAPQRRPTLIAIHYGNGSIGLMQKSFMTEVLLTSHQHVSLIFTSCIITLEGEHLDQLLELLQDEKILSLHCFNLKVHDKPAEGEILITKIERRKSGEVLMKKEK